MLRTVVISSAVRRIAVAAVLLGPGVCVPIGCERESAEPEPALAGQSSPASVANAADEYRSLYGALGEGLIAQLRRADGKLTPELERSLPTAQPVVDRLVWATLLDRCDWGIDYSAGSDTELPHLEKLRELTYLLAVHAAQAAPRGDMDTAAQDVAAIVRLSGHVGGVSAIEAVVAFAMLRLATDRAVEYAAHWSRTQREVVLAELRRLDQYDPLGGNAVIDAHRRIAAREGISIHDQEQWFATLQRRAVEGVAAAIRALK